MRDTRQTVVNNEKVFQRVSEWGMARAERIDAKRAMDACGACEFSEPYEPETGAPGIPRCYQHLSHTEAGDWCVTCLKREPLFQRMKQLKRAERDAFRRLCGCVARNIKPAGASASQE